MRRSTPWCFSAGVLLFHLLPATPPVGCVLALALLVAIGVRVRTLRWLLPCALGFAWVWVRADLRLAQRWPGAWDGRTVVVEGVVSAPVEVHDIRLQCILDVQSVDGGPRLLRARLTWFEAPVVPQPGERWRLQVRLRAPRGFANPGGFDYEGLLFRAGIAATGYVVNSAGNRALARPAPSSLLAWRVALAQRLRTATGDGAHAGVVRALAVGLTDGMSERDWDTLRATGSAHLVAISGLHIGLVAAVAAWLTRRAWGRMGLRRWLAPVDAGACAGLLVATCYAALAGFGVPARRALLMLVVVLGRGVLRRAGPGHAPFAQALAAVLVLDPLAPLAPGFWLSFLAVAVLPLGALGGVAGLRARVHTQWAVTLAVAPLTIAAFDTVSLIAPLVNLVLIPLFSTLVVPPLLLGIALQGLSGSLAAMPLALATGTLDLVWPCLERAATWPFASWVAGPRPLWVLLLAQAGVLLCIAPRALPARWLALPLLLPLFAWHPRAPTPGAYELAVLDVGQGLAVVVRTARHTLLYDTGPRFRSGSDAGALVVLPFLRARGIRVVDRLIVSHDDSDHSGGARTVLQRLPVLTQLSGGRGPAPSCVAGTRWRWDGVDFEVLHPAPGAHWRDNDGSCVLRVAGVGGSALLTGDIEHEAEQALLAGDATLASDIVVAPHHGSATSSSAAFIAAVHARDVVFAVGYENRWGFPRPAVVARWQASGARAWSTARSGALIFVVDPRRRSSAPYQHRRAAHRYWSAR